MADSDSKEPYSDLRNVNDRALSEANYWRLQRIERKLRGIEVMIAGIVSAAIGLAGALVLLKWLG